MISTLKKINFLITKRQRKGLMILTLLLFVGMVLEVLGLGILIPALSILLEPELVEKTPILSVLRSNLSEISDQSFLIFFLLSIVFVYLIKSLFLIFLTFKQNRFLYNITAYLSNNLFTNYMTQQYSFHLNNNISELSKNLQLEISYFNTYILHLITIFIEAGFILAILSTLIYIEPFGALSIGFFYSSLSIIFLKLTKKKLKEWGGLREELDKSISKIVIESLGGIKDILILGKETFYSDQFSSKTYLKSRISSNQGTISQIPRFYLELISIIGLVSFIILMVFNGETSTKLVTVLGVFVAATFRMIPSLNRILAAVQSLKFYQPSINIIYNENKKIKNAKTQNRAKYKFKSKIKFEKVDFGFNQNKNVLNKVDLDINIGETIGIIGESGSGKSTLIDLLIGLHSPTGGNIIIDDDYNLHSTQSWRNNIGYVSQSIFLIDESIKNNIAFGVEKNKINEVRINELIKKVQLEDFIISLNDGIETKVGERGVQLSGGQRQRIGIARALYHDPDLLVLDEATAALDSKTEQSVMNSINKLLGQKTIIIIAHRLSTLGNCNKIFEVKNNQLYLI